MDFYKAYAEKIPIPKCNKSSKENIIFLVTKMLSLNKQFHELPDKSSNQAQQLKSEIEKTDAEIDRLVYELYGLTEEEIKIVEESLKK